METQLGTGTTFHFTIPLALMSSGMHHRTKIVMGSARSADGAVGIVKKKVLPRPGALSTQMRPPWASTMPLTMGSPSPAPPRSGLPRLPEPIEQVRQILGGDAGARVADPEQHLASLRCRPDRDAPAGRA